MNGLLEYANKSEEIYLAGQRAPAGQYREIENHREVYLAHEDALPASLDGRVACYERFDCAWAQYQMLKSLLGAKSSDQ